MAGAGGLLGSELVKAATAEGAEVLAVDLSAAAIQSRLTESWLQNHEQLVTSAELDLTDEEAVVEFFSGLTGFTGAVNATYPRNSSYGARFQDVTLASFNDNVSLHLGSAFLFMRECAALFERTCEAFSLVNVASIYGVRAPDFSVYAETSMTMPVEYAAIKAGIVHLNRYVAAYVRRSAFRVNSISPGGLYDGQPSGFVERYRRKTHGTGMLTAGEMSGAVNFLLSDHSCHVTGQNIIIDDGFTLQ